MISCGLKPRVLVDEDIVFGGTPLSKIIEEAGCELVRGIEEWDPSNADGGVFPPLTLIVVSLDPDARRAVELVVGLRRQESLAEVPILGVSSLGRLEIDYRRLRAVGLTGLVDADAPPEHVRFRVSQIAYKGREARQFERAPCCIPVEVEVEGERTIAYATSLSAGGMGLACSRRIELNTLLALRFELEEGKEPIAVSGRTVRVRKGRRPDGDFEIAVFFHPLPDGVREEISTTVSTLLAAWDTVGAAGLVNIEAADQREVAASRSRRGEPVPEPMRDLKPAFPFGHLRRGSRSTRWARGLPALAVAAVVVTILAFLAVR